METCARAWNVTACGGPCLAHRLKALVSRAALRWASLSARTHARARARTRARTRARARTCFGRGRPLRGRRWRQSAASGTCPRRHTRPPTRPHPLSSSLPQTMPWPFPGGGPAAAKTNQGMAGGPAGPRRPGFPRALPLPGDAPVDPRGGQAASPRPCRGGTRKGYGLGTRLKTRGGWREAMLPAAARNNAAARPARGVFGLGGKGK